MIIFKDVKMFIASLSILSTAIILLHIYYPRIYAKNYRYKHSLVSTVLKQLKTRGNRRLLGLATKILIALLISMALSQPYIVTQKQISIESSEVSELVFDVRPPLIVILDTSGSMGEANKIEIAKKTLIQLIEGIPKSIDIGFIDFSDEIKQAIPPTSDRELIIDAVRTSEVGGGTMYSYPLQAALSWLKPYRELNVSASIVFISDGLPGDLNEYRGLLNEYRELGVPIYTVFIGYDEQGVREMDYIASATNGKAFVAQTIDELAETLTKAMESASRAIQRVEANIRLTKTIDVHIPLTSPLLALATVVYIAYRFIAHRFSGVTL